MFRHPPPAPCLLPVCLPLNGFSTPSPSARGWNPTHGPPQSFAVVGTRLKCKRFCTLSQIPDAEALKSPRRPPCELGLIPLDKLRVTAGGNIAKKPVVLSFFGIATIFAAGAVGFGLWTRTVLQTTDARCKEMVCDFSGAAQGGETLV